MNPISLVWDVLFVSSSYTDNNTSKIILSSIENDTEYKPKTIMNWNMLVKGSKVARSGVTGGFRFIYEITELTVDEILKMSEEFNSYSHDLIANTNISIAEKLPLPLDIKTKKRFPTIGNLMLNVKFTNGLGLNDANKIKAAVNNQTKDTKDSLDPIREGKGSSSGLFSDSFRSALSNSYWFRIFPVGGKPLNDVNIRSAIGGSYDISFDIRDAVSNLVSESIGKWWDPLDPEELTLEPRLLVDYSSPINSNFDPINFYHQNKNVSNLIDNVLKIEAEQTNDQLMIDDLTYTLERITRGRRGKKQLTKDNGLMPGIEQGLIEREIIKPWFAEEFINCLTFFLMTRKPKYWRNGSAEIELLQPFSIDLVESLKEGY